jgi:hypothetical protein
MEKYEETGISHIRFSHPQRPSASFTHPAQLNKLTLPVFHIFSLQTTLKLKEFQTDLNREQSFTTAAKVISKEMFTKCNNKRQNIIIHTT